MNKIDKVIEVLNELLELCEPIKFDEFNRFYKIINKKKLEKYKEKYSTTYTENRIKHIEGKRIYEEGISTLGMITSMGEILSGQRIQPEVRISDNRIVGFTYFQD